MALTESVGYKYEKKCMAKGANVGTVSVVLNRRILLNLWYTLYGKEGLYIPWKVTWPNKCQIIRRKEGWEEPDQYFLGIKN